jgi:hypothetical protein
MTIETLRKQYKDKTGKSHDVIIADSGIKLGDYHYMEWLEAKLIKLYKKKKSIQYIHVRGYVKPKISDSRFNLHDGKLVERGG